MNRIKWIVTFLVGAMILACAGCAGAGTEARMGTGVRSNSQTVSQILEQAAQTAAPAPAAGEPTPEPDSEPMQPPVPGHSTERTDNIAPGGKAIDIDLTQLNSTMVYSEVYNMMTEPEAYLGKTVRLNGFCTSAYYEPTDMTYYAVIIPDAAACCAQGIEYVLAEGGTYPADDAVIRITGTFELYEELGTEYCRLGNAVIEA